MDKEMKWMNVTRKAIVVAKHAHVGQTDKCGMPYWLHPYRVGLAVACYGEDAIAVGFLHDVLEDTRITPRFLRQLRFEEHIIDAVVTLSRKNGESYSKYIKRIEQNEIAIRVKIADLTDNLRYDRIRNLWGKSKFVMKTKGMYEQYLDKLIEKYPDSRRVREGYERLLPEFVD